MSKSQLYNSASGQWFPVSTPGAVFGFYSRCLPEHPSKLRIVRGIARSFFGPGMLFCNRGGLGRLLVDPLDAIGMEILRYGGYEPQSLARAVCIMRNGGSFLDVGANFGLYTVPIARLAGTRCIAVDASEVAIGRLRDNLRRNALDQVRVLEHGAASKNAGRVRIATVQASNLGSTRIISDSVSDPGAQWVESQSLDEILRLHAPAAEPIQLFKLDVEGFEQNVLESFDFGGPFRPANILMECDPDGFAGAEAAFEYVKSKGYSAFTVEGKVASNLSELPEHNVWFLGGS